MVNSIKNIFSWFLGGNYKLEAPPHSYIDVNDFESVESLAMYLKTLQNDKENYQEYFSWKREYLLYQKDPWLAWPPRWSFEGKGQL